MKVWVLGSGSGGNAVLVESGESRVLVDAGFGTRMLSTRKKLCSQPAERRMSSSRDASAASK